MPARRRRSVKARSTGSRCTANRSRTLRNSAHAQRREAIEARSAISSIGEILVVMGDKTLTLRLRSGEINAINGRSHNGPGVEVIIIDDAIKTRFALHDSSPCDLCQNYSQRLHDEKLINVTAGTSLASQNA